MDGNSNAVLQAIYQRRSVRSFEPGRLAKGTIQQLLAAAVRAPTAIHEEQWAFVVVQGSAAIKALSAALFAPSTETNLFHDADTLILVCAQPMGPFVTADCWLAAGNIMLAAQSMGLGSCVIGSAISGLNKPEIKQQLGIADEISVVVPVVLGLAKGGATAAPTPRKAPQVLAWLTDLALN